MMSKEIKFIWNESDRSPYYIDDPILVQTQNNKLIVFKDTKTYINNNKVSNWQRLIEKYKIKY